MGRFILLSGLLVLQGCHLYYQMRDPAEIDGRTIPMLEYKEAFYIYYDPDISVADLEATMEMAYQQWQSIAQDLLQLTELEPISVVLYKDQKDYLSHRSTDKDSLARYDRKTRRMYLAYGAARDAWRHELVHAILDQKRQTAWRVHEGLAYFLQYQDFGGSVSCAPATRARGVDRAGLSALLPAQMDAFFSHWSSEDRTPQTARLAAAYMQFLWQKKALKSSLSYYLKYPHSHLEYELTRGDRVRMRELYLEFRRWLGQGQVQKYAMGC